MSIYLIFTLNFAHYTKTFNCHVYDYEYGIWYMFNLNIQNFNINDDVSFRNIVEGFMGRPFNLVPINPAMVPSSHQTFTELTVIIL